MIKTGQIFNLMMLIFCTIAAIYFMYRARIGKKAYIRSIKAIEVLPELVGRATEMGRPIHFTGGQVGFTSPWFSVGVMSSLLVYGELVKLAAPTGTRVIHTLADPASLPIAEDIGSTAAGAAGHPEYKQDLRFLSTEPRVYMAGIMGIIAREKIAAQVSLAGAEETLTIVDAATTVGAMQIGGSSGNLNVCWYVTGCDYFMIGEENYAIAAILGDDPSISGSLAGEDIVKILLLALIIIGSIMATSANKWLINLISV